MDFVAGSIAGCAGQLVGHPLDSIKTRLQSETLTHQGWTSMLSCARALYAEGGSRAFFRGLSLPLVSKSIEQCVAFGIHGASDRALGQMGLAEGSLRTGAAGVAAGTTTALLLTPVYLVKVQLQVTSRDGAKGLAGPLDAVSRTVSRLGFAGLYTGATPIFLGTGIGYAFRFVAYQRATDALEESMGFGRTAAAIVGGGLAGMATWASHYPLDLIASRMEASVALDGPRLSMAGHFQEVYAREGVPGFFRGIGPCLARAFPVNAIIFLTYDFCKQHFG